MNNAINATGKAIFEASIEAMSAKTGISKDDVVAAISAGIPNAVKMFKELCEIGAKTAQEVFA